MHEIIIFYNMTALFAIFDYPSSELLYNHQDRSMRHHTSFWKSPLLKDEKLCNHRLFTGVVAGINP